MFSKYIMDQIEERPLEYILLKKLLKALGNAGHGVTAVDEIEEVTPVTTVEEIIEIAFNLDTFFLITQDGDNWIRMVMGEEPCDMIVDYTMPLREVLEPVYEWAERYSH